MRPGTKEDEIMSDPRFSDKGYTDPRQNDPNFIQPAPPRNESVGGIWGWVAGLAVVALIAFVVIAGWNSSPTNTASGPGASAPVTTGSNMRDVTPPSTTGSGATSPRPMTNPATPSAPPAKQ
jgi:hypothetical protein